MLSRFFIYHPIAASVISVVIVIAGVVSFGALPVAKNPEIAPPTVQVQCFYPGANAQVVAETVATPIETEVNGVEDMIYMSSTCGSDGSYNLTVTFDIGTDLDMATVLVQNRVSVAQAKLPEEVRRQGVTTRKQSTQILQFITLYSPDNSYDSLTLSNYALDIRDRLSRIEGVGFVQVFGAGDYSMRVWLDPERLDSLQMTTDEVAQAIREQNVQVAAGQIGAPPAPQGQAFQYTINAQGRLKTEEEFGNIVVRSQEGRIVRLKDVARIELGAKDYLYNARYGSKEFKDSEGSKPCTAIAVYQLPGANALQVAEKVRAEMKTMSSEGTWLRGAEYEIPFDTTLFVTASVQEVYETIFIAVGLVVLVIFVFLQDWRSTLVPVVAIPVSLIGTFAFMQALGFSINMLSLFGIVLAIGIVVDDAIVVVENCSRHIDNGLPPKEAAVRAMQEISGPVIATSLVLLAVFVPTTFMPGITGQLYRQFALTISAAVIISTVNALTMSPALCGMLLRPTKDSWMRKTVFGWFNSGFDFFTGKYGFVMSVMVRRVAIVMILFAVLVALTGVGLSRLPTGFVPDEDQGYLFVNVQLPDAASQQRTQAVMEQVDEILKETPGVTSRVVVSGYSLLSSSSGSNLGLVVVVLEPWEERQSPQLQQVGMLAHLKSEFEKIDEAIVFPFGPPPIDGLGSAGGFQMEVQDRGGAGFEALQGVTQEMIEAGRGQTGLTQMNTTFRASVPQLYADVDRTKVSSLDLPLTAVFGTLQTYLGSAYINDFTLNNRTYQVRVQADQQFRATPEAIEALQVRNADGKMVPIGSVLDVQETFAPSSIRRYKMFPAVSINGSAAPGYSSGQALQIMEGMADNQLPDTMGYEWTGMSYQEKAAGGGQALILFLAVVLVFLVLAFQYESLTSPAAVIAVVPLAALGVVIMLMVRGMDLNTYSQIGLVLLVALASKNAILIVEFAMEQRRKGLTIFDSASQAAALRFRAILMTAFSSILGFMPLLIAAGAGAASRQAVGNSVVGGMVAATFFCLMFVPSFFVLFQGLAEMFGKVEPAAETAAKDAKKIE